MKDDLSKRMKEQYEDRTRYYLPRRTFNIIRVDGKSFSKYTSRFKKPFDTIISDAMDFTLLSLCKEIQNVKFGYTQSDEISLLLTDFDDIKTQAWFDGNIQKITSISASIATKSFNKFMVKNYLTEKLNNGNTTITEKFIENIFNIKWADFDSRVFTIPDRTEVENYFIWREKDAVRNSISGTAQALYKNNKTLLGKSCNEMQEMCFQKGVNWNDTPVRFKRGCIVYKKFDENLQRGKWTSEPVFDFNKERELLSKLIPNY